MSHNFETLLVIFMIIGALVLGVMIGIQVTQENTKIQAIHHHAAHYDSQTGKFQWNDETLPGVQLPQSH